MNNALKTGLLLVLLVGVIILAPLATIAALNTIFGLSIVYTFWTWLSIVWLQVTTFGSIASAIGKK